MLVVEFKHTLVGEFRDALERVAFFWSINGLVRCVLDLCHLVVVLVSALFPRLASLLVVKIARLAGCGLVNLAILLLLLARFGVIRLFLDYLLLFLLLFDLAVHFPKYGRLLLLQLVQITDDASQNYLVPQFFDSQFAKVSSFKFHQHFTVDFMKYEIRLVLPQPKHSQHLAHLLGRPLLVIPD